MTRNRPTPPHGAALAVLSIAMCAPLVLAACSKPVDDKAAAAGANGAANPNATGGASAAGAMLDPREKHLKNLKQLTFGGENAEAYFSFAGDRLIFQSTRDELGCDQIFVMKLDGSDVHMVSDGRGRCTCSYFLPGDSKILYASTHLASPDCPPPPDRSHGYAWAVYPSFDIFTANADGSNVARLTETPGYDAEATVSPDGKKIVFTSARDGDLDVYVMNVDGTDVKRLTDAVGYDGGPFFSPDSKRICWRCDHLDTDEERKTFKDLLGKGLVRPFALELWVMDADGGNKRQVTKNGAANFGPFFTPDGKKLIYASNVDDSVHHREFDLYLVDIDSGATERVTYTPQFDGFPMFSPDGKRLVFASNRNGKQQGETDIFIADWVD